jgi:hypothetical protein
MVAIPARPTDDALVDPAWGQWVHDSLVGAAPGVIIGITGSPAVGAGATLLPILAKSTVRREVGGTWMLAATATTVTVPVGCDGLYLCIGSVVYNANAGGGARTVEIRVDGAAPALPYNMTNNVPPGTAAHYVQSVQVIPLAAGQTIGLSAFNDGAATTLYQASLSLTKLGSLGVPGTATVPGFVMYHAAALPTTTGVWATLPFVTADELRDVGNWFTQGTSTTRFVCPEPGVYNINASLTFDAHAATPAGRFLSYNVSGVNSGVTDLRNNIASIPMSMILADQRRLIAGDYLELVCEQFSGATLNVTGTRFSAIKVADA